MEPISSLLIPAITETVFGALAEATGLSDWLRQRLGRDPERLAFQSALTQALTDAAHTFPGRDLRYFTEILRDVGGPLLARTLQPAATFPTPEELTQLWLNHLTIDSAIHYRQEFAAFATLLLDQLNQHIENQQPLQWIVQARRLRSNEEATRRLAEAAEQGSATLHVLQQELVKLTGALESVLKIGNSTVSTAGGAYVAGSVSAHNFAGRDLTIKNYFVAGLVRLPTNYTERIENFLFTYLGGDDERVPFGGRQTQLDELNHWVDDPAAPPYYLMVAEAGKGKSALVCRWSAQLTTRPDLDVIFVPISIRFQTAAQDVFFGALAARLAQLHEKQTPDLFYKTNTATDWKAVCESYLRQPLPDGKRLVVILDGLDEATDWLAGPELFAVRPPSSLRVLVTARLRVKESDALGWAATLNWEGPRLARKVTLPALDRQGVEEALASMGNPLDGLATQIDIVGKLYYLSEGDPLLVRLYVDELVKKKAQASFLTLADLDTIQPGLAGFMQKWWEDQRKQWRMQKKDPHAEEERLLPLLSACAVAYGPLLLKDLAALDATHFGAARAVVNRAELLGRWLIGDGTRQGYVFAHPRLREFFSGPTWLSDEEHAAWQTKFCSWGERVLIALNSEKLEPKQAPEYLLRNYATHLAQNAALPERFYALISDGWRKAWEELDVSYAGFLNDVDQAWERARLAYDANQPGRAEALMQQVRAALCRSSVAALGGNMLPQLLAQLVAAGLRTPVQALAMVKFIADERRQIEMLAALTPHLPGELLGEALAIANTIRDPYPRTNTLVALAPYLSAELLGEVLRTVCTIGDEVSNRIVYFTGSSKGHHAYALVKLAPYLPTELLEEALIAARAIEDEPSRTRVLVALAPRLPESERVKVLKEALSAARAIYTTGDAKACAAILVGLAPHLPVDLLEEGLSIAHTIWWDTPSCSDALIALTPHLPVELLEKALSLAHTMSWWDIPSCSALVALVLRLPEIERVKTLMEALITARSLDYRKRANALSSLLPHLPESERGIVQMEALSVARSIGNGKDRTGALIALAQYLPENERVKILMEALNVARTIQSTKDHTDALVALVPYLPSELLEDAMHYIDVLSVLAPHLSAKLLEEALVTARALKKEMSLAHALCVLAPHLSENERLKILTEALSIICKDVDEDYRTVMLSALAPHLPVELLGAALSFIYEIRDEPQLITMLVALAPHMSERKRAQTLRAALSAVYAIAHGGIRAGALCELAPHLPVELLGEALSIAREIAHSSAPNAYGPDGSSAQAMVALIPYLPTDLIEEVLRAVYEIRSEFYRDEVLVALAPHLPVELLGQALVAAHTIGDESHRANVLVTLAKYLPELASHLPENEQAKMRGEELAAVCAIENLLESEWGKVSRDELNTACAISDERERSAALVALATNLPVERLGEALSAARAIKYGGYCADILIALAPYLPDELLGEALSAARAIRDGSVRSSSLFLSKPELLNCANVLVALAPHLPSELLGEALSIARALGDENGRANVLVALAPYLPKNERRQVLEEALAAALVLENEDERYQVLVVLAPQLPESEWGQVLEKALIAARTIRNKGAHVNAWVALVQHLASWASQQPQQAYSSFADTLSIISTRPRPEFMSELAALMPFILALAGDEAPQAAEGIFHAIQEVCAWWP